LAALRSYQEAHNNYFEVESLDFSKAFQINIDTKIAIDDLNAVLTEEYGYRIQEIAFQSKKS
jgi:hypothetical protein